MIVLRRRLSDCFFHSQSSGIQIRHKDCDRGSLSCTLWRTRRRMKIWSAQVCLRLSYVSKAAAILSSSNGRLGTLFSEQLFMRPGAHPVTHEKLWIGPCVPEGRHDSSPALQCRDWVPSSATSPVGTTEKCTKYLLSRPYGTRSSYPYVIPALKCRAIFTASLRDAFSKQSLKYR